MDAFSAALNSVHVTAAIFVEAEFTAPWGFVSPPAEKVAPIVAPGMEQLVMFHLITSGEVRLRIEDGPELIATGGDIVIVPHGDEHIVSNGEPAYFPSSLDAIGEMWSGVVETGRFGGGGAVTKIICGFFGCERHAVSCSSPGCRRS